MAEADSKGVTKLRRFRSSVMEAADLFSSASEMLTYSFGKDSSLKESVEETWREAKEGVKQVIRQIIGEICESVFASTRDSVVALVSEKGLTVNLKAAGSWPIYARCTDSALTKVVSDSIVLFHAVYEARSIEGLFSDIQLDEMEEIFVAVSSVLRSSESKDFKLELPPFLMFYKSIEGLFSDIQLDEMEEIFVAISSVLRSSESKDFKLELPHKVVAAFIGESVVRSVKGEKEEVPEFVAACQCVFEKFSKNQYDIDDMVRLAGTSSLGILKEAEQLMLSFSKWLPTIVNVCDVRVAGAYLELMKKIFMSCEDINGPMRQVYTDFSQATNELPSFRALYREYNIDFVALMNGMGEHTQFQDKHDRLDSVVREFAYLLLVAPKNTIWCILMDCIVNRLIVPNVLKVLRRLPAVLELELELGQVEGGTSKRSLPLITAALRIIASKEKASLVSAESRASFIYLVSALVREKRSALKNEQVIEEGVTQKYGEVIDKAVLDGNEVLLDFVLPLLFSDDDAEIALGIMCRMFGDYECKRTPIRWDVLVTERISVKPNDSDVNVKMALSFIDSIPENVQNDKLVAMCGVMESLIGVLDPTFKSNRFIFCNESTIYGLRLVAPLMFIGDSVILAQHVLESESNSKNQQQAEKLLSVWCQRAKNLIDREVIDLRRSRLIHVPDIRLALLQYNHGIVSQQLRLLLATLADYDAEVNRMGAGPVLDYIRTDSKNDGVFYAFADNEDTAYDSKENHKINEGAPARSLPENGAETTENASDTKRSVQRKSKVVCRQAVLRDRRTKEKSREQGDAITVVAGRDFCKEGTSATNALFEMNASMTTVAFTLGSGERGVDPPWLRNLSGSSADLGKGNASEVRDLETTGEEQNVIKAEKSWSGRSNDQKTKRKNELDGRNPRKEDGEIVSDEVKWSGSEIDGDFRNGSGEWKGYAAKNPIYFEPRRRTGGSASAASKNLPVKTNLATERKRDSATSSSRGQLYADGALKVMVEQVGDASTREMLEKKINCSYQPPPGSNRANHTPREHSDGASHSPGRGGRTSGKRLSLGWKKWLSENAGKGQALLIIIVVEFASFHRWLEYEPVGKPIHGTRFVPFKTPLSSEYFANRGENFDADDIFEIKTIVAYANAHSKEIGLVIDLTATEKYYDPQEWTDRGIEYVKIKCNGHTAYDQEGSIKRFFEAVTTFLRNNADNDKLIGVHCTHGVNRTGYLICRYLIEVDGWVADIAVQEFEYCRGYRIEREKYLTSLWEECVRGGASQMAVR
ncbi:RNA/RNP complex-1-interacting phosphatase [Toxocara canis]|uniref:RNA/RNP complex-1-interacting phosphatase n=1 Tax=Toxocara canis TaxID=6265 RepID=A0A0B2VF97_TOXCA|nr:RNA/RNP complex-1-interacting phosphatase [Toxocara canis]